MLLLQVTTKLLNCILSVTFCIFIVAFSFVLNIVPYSHLYGTGRFISETVASEVYGLLIFEWQITLDILNY